MLLATTLVGLSGLLAVTSAQATQPSMRSQRGLGKAFMHELRDQKDLPPLDLRAAKLGSPVNTLGHFHGALPFEAQILKWLQEEFADHPHKSYISSMLDEQESYDFNANLPTVELLRRVGFEARTHESTSYDGYVTQLVQIYNPKQREHLHGDKRHTVVFYAGQGVSPAAFLVPSLEKYRPVEFGPKLASGESYFERTHFYDRSLALTLVNSGFDVWLVPARGVDQANRRRVEPGKSKNLLMGSHNPFAHLYGELQRHDYWSFSSDEIIRHELRQQFDLVREYAGCDKFTLISYSNGALLAFGFLAQEPGYARHIETHISLAPAVFVNKFNPILSGALALAHLSPPLVPFLEDHVDALARGSFVQLCRSKLVRYSVCKLLLNSLYGFSPAFETFLELRLFDYIGRPSSPNGLKQTLQTALSGHLRHFDFGPLGNWFIYGHFYPREYKLDECKVPRTYLLSGSRDSIVDRHSIELLSKQLGERPKQWLEVEGYNHLDMLFGWDVAVKVNKPILAMLKDEQMEANYYDESGEHEHTGEHEHGGEHDTEHLDDQHEENESEGEDARSINASASVRPPPSLVGPPTAAPTATTKKETNPRALQPQQSQTTTVDANKLITGKPKARTQPTKSPQTQTKAGDAKQSARQLNTGGTLKQKPSYANKQTRAPRADSE